MPTKGDFSRTLIFVFLALFSFVICFDYLWRGTQPANFDAFTHVTSIEHFYLSLREGDFPVGWADGFANYGLPLGQIAHQVPTYLGALLTFVTGSSVYSFYIVYLFATIASAWTMYRFSRDFFDEKISVMVTMIYLLAPYRIMNLYIRGAMPEYFSAVWPPLILHLLYHVYRGRANRLTYLTLSICIGLLFLTHPMLTLVYLPFILLFVLWHMPSKREILFLIIAAIGGLGLAAYYIVPLTVESKFFYHGITSNHFAPNQHITLASFTDAVWHYTCAYRGDIFGRCHEVKVGVTETIIMMVALIVIVGQYLVSRACHEGLAQFVRSHRFALFLVTSLIMAIFMASSASELLYRQIRLLSTVQYPWRFLSVLMFIPPLMLGYLCNLISTRLRVWILLGMCGLIIMLRFPQLYAKNYMAVSESVYQYTPNNLHSFMMNTIWTGDTAGYPIHPQKGEIVQGQGTITKRIVTRQSRTYSITATTDVLVNDYTFYFPGWQLWVDGVEQEILFQDPAYRGVITFKVPKGSHTVTLRFSDTRTRQYAKYISIVTLCCMAGYSIYVMRGAKTKVREVLT